MSVLSTNQSPSEVDIRRRQKDGSRTEVPCPLAIKIILYNLFMDGVGGVDKNDQLRGYYSVISKKLQVNLLVPFRCCDCEQLHLVWTLTSHRKKIIERFSS